MKEYRKHSILSTTSLGYLPVMISAILGLMIKPQHALPIGAIVGIVLSSAHYMINRHRGKHDILYTSTIVVSTCSILYFTGYPCFQIIKEYMPLALEMALFFPLLIIYFRRKKISPLPSSGKPQALNERICMKVLTISNIYNYFWLTLIHLAIIVAGLLYFRSFYNAPMWFITQIVPILIFTLCIFVAQFNQRLIDSEKTPEIIPIVTPQGEVVGRIDKQTTLEGNAEHTYPVIRIAIVSHGMLYLNKRPSDSVVEKNKIDLPLETYLLYNEGVKNGMERLIKEKFGAKSNELLPTFSIKYRYAKGAANQLIYLFILDLDESEAFCNATYFKNGKLWTFQQIEDNLGKGYFSDTFENEYDHLKLVIETREIYKEF